MSLIGGNTNTGSIEDEYGTWAAEDADDMTRFDAAKAREEQPAASTADPEADVIGSLIDHPRC